MGSGDSLESAEYIIRSEGEMWEWREGRLYDCTSSRSRKRPEKRVNRSLGLFNL